MSNKTLGMWLIFSLGIILVADIVGGSNEMIGLKGLGGLAVIVFSLMAAGRLIGCEAECKKVCKK